MPLNLSGENAKICPAFLTISRRVVVSGGAHTGPSAAQAPPNCLKDPEIRTWESVSEGCKSPPKLNLSLDSQESKLLPLPHPKQLVTKADPSYCSDITSVHSFLSCHLRAGRLLSGLASCNSPLTVLPPVLHTITRVITLNPSVVLCCPKDTIQTPGIPWGRHRRPYHNLQNLS